MKPEPLKGKYKYEKGIWKEKILDNDGNPLWMLCTTGQEDVLDDVKSAIQGLLEEIEEIRKLHIPASEKVIRFDPNNPHYNLGLVRGLELAKEKIKKWLGGAFND